MDNQVEKIRLQKFFADSGIASIKKREEYILDGRIKVNGSIVTELGTKVDPESDIVEFDDIKVNNDNKKYVYILLNKPIGVVTTAEDQFGRDTVLDLV